MLYHGTTLERAREILKHGFLGGINENWTVSDGNIYFWSSDKLVEMDECEQENADWFTAERAYESGQCALAYGGSQVVVFEVDADITDDDDSCKNMEGAVVSYDPVPADKIRRMWISPDLSLLRGYFISIMIRQDMAVDSFSHYEKEVANLMSGLYVEPGDFELEEIKELP
jgi:hypothetical protein